MGVNGYKRPFVLILEAICAKHEFNIIDLAVYVCRLPSVGRGTTPHASLPTELGKY